MPVRCALKSLAGGGRRWKAYGPTSSDCFLRERGWRMAGLSLTLVLGVLVIFCQLLLLVGQVATATSSKWELAARTLSHYGIQHESTLHLAGLPSLTNHAAQGTALSVKM